MISFLALLPKLAILIICTLLFIWVMSLVIYIFYVEMNKIIWEFKYEENKHKKNKY